jgi:hypothetical protein
MREFMDSVAGHLTLLSLMLASALTIMIWLEIFIRVPKDSLSLLAAKELFSLSLGPLIYAMRIAVKMNGNGGK